MLRSICSRVRQFAPTRSLEGKKTQRTNANKRTLTPFFTFLKKTLNNFFVWLTPSFDREIDPNRYELKKFHILHTSTHRDGVSIPETGFHNEHVLYDLRVVYSCSTAYVNGDTVPPEEHGEPAFLLLARVAEVYRSVMGLAEHQAGRRILADSHPAVECTAHELHVLKRHRDFLRLRRYWLNRGYDLVLYEMNRELVGVFLELLHPTGGRQGKHVRSRARVDII